MFAFPKGGHISLVDKSFPPIVSTNEKFDSYDTLNISKYNIYKIYRLF